MNIEDPKELIDIHVSLNFNKSKLKNQIEYVFNDEEESWNLVK